jgi:hypothetical protein
MLICLQQNVGRSYPHLITLLQNALKSGAHCVLIQEPAYREEGILITIPAYIPIQPNYIGDLPRVTAYWRKDLPFQYRQLNPRWVIPRENRIRKMHRSVILSFDNEEMH